MNHSTTFTAELDQIEVLYEVSDEAVEAAAGNEALPAITMFCTPDAIGPPRLLRHRSERPCDSSAHKGDKLAPPHHSLPCYTDLA
jgi:hypothetical protein